MLPQPIRTAQDDAGEADLLVQPPRRCRRQGLAGLDAAAGRRPVVLVLRPGVPQQNGTVVGVDQDHPPGLPNRLPCTL